MDRVLRTSLRGVRCRRICRYLTFVGLTLLTNSMCSSGASRPDSGGIADGYPYIKLDVVTIPPPNGPDTAAIDTEPLPRCCTEAVILTPNVGAGPCTFALPDPPPPHLDDVGVYLNRNLVDADSTDGWTYDPTKTSIVFVGASCEAIMSDAQAPVVQLFCRCPPFPCGYPGDLCF